MGLLTDQQLKDDWRGVVCCDVSRRLPYPDESVWKIYSSYFLEHTPYPSAVNVVKERHRVLRRDGTMRLVLPDVLWHAERYVEKTRQLGSADPTPTAGAPGEFMETVCGAYLDRRRYGAAHWYMYDYPTLLPMLRDLGFRRVKRCRYREGTDQELASFDKRSGESHMLKSGGNRPMDVLARPGVCATTSWPRSGSHRKDAPSRRWRGTGPGLAPSSARCELTSGPKRWGSFLRAGNGLEI